MCRFYPQAFASSNITSVLIPKSVIRIVDFAFSYASRLEEVIFESGSLLETIGFGVSSFPCCARTSRIMFRSSNYVSRFLFVGIHVHEYSIVGDPKECERDSLSSFL